MRSRIGGSVDALLFEERRERADGESRANELTESLDGVSLGRLGVGREMQHGERVESGDVVVQECLGAVELLPRREALGPDRAVPPVERSDDEANATPHEAEVERLQEPNLLVRRLGRRAVVQALARSPAIDSRAHERGMVRLSGVVTDRADRLCESV